jgi:hypothetical protein
MIDCGVKKLKNLFIMGNPGSGKTAVALGIAQKLRQEGYNVGYFKPVGNGRGFSGHTDGDAVLMKKVLDMKAPLERITPLLAGPSHLTGYKHMDNALENMKSAYEEVSRGCDVVLMDGSFYPYILASCNLDSVSLAKEFNAKVLLVIKIEDDYSLDRAVFYNRYLQSANVPVFGNIFSNVPRPLFAKTEGIFAPILAGMGFKTAGIIPSRAEIASPTVAEYYDVLGGEVLAGGEHMYRMVEDVVIGAMNSESALTYLRRTANKAVIMGGDRADLALAALETHTSVLILTGGLYPDVKVIARAAEKEVPVILVHTDTYKTIEKLERVSRHIQPTDRVAINIALENIEEYCNWKAIKEGLEA